MNNKVYNRILYCTLSIFLLILVVLLCNSCKIKKDIQKSSEVTNTDIRTNESTTLTTIESGTLVTKGDSIESVLKIDSLPVTVVTNLPGIVTTTSFDPRTKTVKTKTVQKPIEVPILRTLTAVSNKTIEVKQKQEKKNYSKHKETGYNWLWIILIAIIIFLYILWKRV